MMLPVRWVVSALPLLAVVGCDFEQPITPTEMRQAVDEVVLTGDAEGLEDGVIEITTSFTLGNGLQAIVEEVRAFAHSQVPCSTVSSPDPMTLVIDFGDLEDGCEYRGRTYAGVVTVHWADDGDAIVVEHDYAGLTNGRVTVDGSAVVTWSEAERRVRTDFTFTGPDAEVEVSSDRTQTRIGEIGDGIEVEGWRRWVGPRGTWDLDIDTVQMRAMDPVPQAGAYTLTIPDGQELSMTFERVDEDTIAVEVHGTRRDRTFHVTSEAEVSD